MFTGYGGLDMAVLAFYGGSLAWYAEVEPAACKVLAAHHPEVLNLGDVTRIDWTQVEPVDAITAGYPCQPFSHAGKRKGKNDERHLWPYVRDAIGALGPSHVVLENVAGHLSMGLADVIGDLAGLGYDARWGVVRASDAGAPHRRARVFIVASDSDSGRRQQCKPKALSQGDFGLAGLSADSGGQRHGSGQGPAGMGRVDRAHEGSARERQRPRQEPGAGGAADAADSSDDERKIDASHDLIDGERSAQWRGAVVTAGTRGGGVDSFGRLAGPHAASGSTSTIDVADAADANGAGSETRVDAGHDGQWVRVEPMGLAAPAADADGSRKRVNTRVTPSSQAGPHAGDGPHGAGGAWTDWGKYAPAIHRWERALGRPAPSPTIPGANGKQRLSPSFVEWMMGLPEGHVTGHGLSSAQALKMLGNGVVPQQAYLALGMLA